MKMKIAVCEVYLRRLMSIMAFVVFAAAPSQAPALSVGDKDPLLVATSTHGNVILEEFQGKKHVVLADLLC
jgi:hypothetical protein